jgi:adenine/guanine phosphoribosyltransferase-like PRPP-binding protein
MRPFAPLDFWQELCPAGTLPRPAAGFDGVFPATLPDGREIALPIRALPGEGGEGVASLIVTQASFAVERALVAAMAACAATARPEVVVGVPTLGLPLARGVAEALGHARYAALGTSRKFWYDEALSAPLSSITSPGQDKRLWLDPRLLPLLAGRRILLVDDVVSTGRSMAAALDLLARAGVAPVAIAVAMTQTRAWQARLGPAADLVTGAIATPLLKRTPEGFWHPAQ